MNSVKIRGLIAIFCPILVALLTQTAQAQNDGYLTDSNTRGFAPGNSFQLADIDYINLGNGALNLHIPLVDRKGRGLDSGAFVTYNSKIWTIKPVWDGILPHTLDSVFWILSNEAGNNALVHFGTINSGVIIYNTDGADCSNPSGTQTWSISVDYGFKYVLQDGTAYQFPNRHYTQTPPGPPHCITGTGNFDVGYSDNGTFELDTATLPYTVHFKDGRKAAASYWDTNNIFHPATLTDTNGNFFDPNGDTLKRTISLTYNNNTALTVLDSNGNNQTYTLQNSGQIPSSTQFPTTSCSGIPIYQSANNFFGGSTTLTLPDGRNYVFTYDPTFNEVTQVTLPTGGYIRYEYTTLANWDKGPYFKYTCATSLDSRRVSARFVSPDGNSQHEQQWQYAYGRSGSLKQTTVTDPVGNVTVHSFDTSVDVYGMHETLTQYYDNAGQLLRTAANAWASEEEPVQLPMGGPATCDLSNWRMTSATTTLADTSQVKQVLTNFDIFTYSNVLCSAPPSPPTTSRGNVTSQLEYDWGNGLPGPLLRRTVDTYLHDSNSNYVTKHILDRVASKTVYDNTGNQCRGQSQACAQTTYGYDTTSIATKSGVVQHDYTNYPSTMIYRGNPTTIGEWRNTDGTWLTTTHYYDELGNLIQTADPLSHSTYFDYTDSWSGTACIPSGGTGNAFVTKSTNTLTQFTTAKYYPCTSLVASSTDLNSQTTSFNYDGLDRLALKTLPDGGQTAHCYSDISGGSCYSSTLPPYVVTTVKITSALNLIATTQVDGLGRVIQTQLNSASPSTYTDTTYDTVGHVYSVSNPHFSTSFSTDGITTYSYDALGRVCVVAPPDGTVPSGTSCPTTPPNNDVFTSYSGNTTTVTDQAGKSRKSVVDALGRLTAVFEDPVGANYETDYQYDVLGNLIRVDQKGGDSNSAHWRTRTFAYNSLSQLLCAANPEIAIVTCPNPDTGAYTTGTIRYGYDNVGNVVSKTAPKPNQTASATVATTYSYDALNRLTQKSYNDGSTPAVKYGYDGVALSGCAPAPPTLTDSYPVGRRTSMCDGSGATSWSHEQMGRAAAEKRTIAGSTNVTKTISYAPYNLDGSVASVTYPSGRIITYAPSGAGRPLSAVDTANNINYLTNATYAPPGELYQFSNGSSLAGAMTYNSRQQPLQLYFTTGTISSGTLTQLGQSACPTSAATLMSRSYNFGAGTNDNGNVQAITDCLKTDRTQNFDYDNLNRLLDGDTTGKTTATTNWGEVYTIDAWGNLTNIAVKTGWQNSESLNAAPGSVQNQLNGFCYDAAGNMTGWTCPSSTYSYDAENRLTASAGYTYRYDGDGTRVIKCNGVYPSCSSGTLYWTGAGSDTLAETDWTGAATEEYVFFSGRRLARRDGTSNTVHYYFSDHLGSASIITSATGTIQKSSVYYPYGGEIAVTGPSFANNYKFTGKERDAESGLDNFGARYYGSSLGRLTGPDSLEVANLKGALFHSLISNPQNWNKYQYAHNSPLVKTDFAGYLTVVIPGTGWSPRDWNNNSAFVKAVGATFKETPVLLNWSGGNSRQARTEGAKMLQKLVKEHHFAKGERLNIVAHSHGGNVALEASTNTWIDVLITLGTPVRDDYPGNSQNIGLWIQGYAPGDDVQVRGGYGDSWCWGQGECGPAGREFADADDNVDTGIETGPLASHSDLWRDPSVWTQMTSHMQESAGEVCNASNGANTAACGVASGH